MIEDAKLIEIIAENINMFGWFTFYFSWDNMKIIIVLKII